MKNYRIFVGILALALVFGFAACEGPVGPAGSGTPGVGTPGTTYLAGSQTTAVIQHAIDAGGPLVLAAVTQSDAEQIFIPAGRGVRIIGALTTAATSSVLVIADASSVDLADGTIFAGSTNPVIIAPKAVIDTGKISNTTKLIPFAVASSITDGVIPAESIKNNVTALIGNVTVKTTGAAAGEISVAQFASNTVFVLGNVTKSDALTTTVEIIASGDVTQAAAISVGTLTVKGNYTSSVTSAASVAGALTVGGDATFSGAAAATGGATAVTGKLTSEGAVLTAGNVLTAGSLEAKGLTLSSETGGLTVGGAANITATLTTGVGSQELTFGGVTAIKTLANGHVGTIILGAGAVTIADALATTATNTVIVKNTAGVTLTAENTIAANLKATKAVVKGDGSMGITIKDNAGTIVVPVGASIVVGEGASLVAGGSTGKITVTKSTLKAGTYSATDASTNTLLLATSTELEVGAGGEIAIAAAGALAFTDGGSKVTILSGGKISAPSTGNITKTGAAVTDLRLKVATTALPGTGTKSSATGSPNFVIVTEPTTGSVTACIVGKTSFSTANATTDIEGAVNGGVDGSITAGAGTTLTIVGT
jgi:hypothetical protein